MKLLCTVDIGEVFRDVAPGNPCPDTECPGQIGWCDISWTEGLTVATATCNSCDEAWTVFEEWEEHVAGENPK